MSHCDKILDALRDGQWHTTSHLYREVGPMILHSRISDLRKRGHTIEGRHVPGMTGADGYQYRLLQPADDRAHSVRREASPTPMGAAAPPAEQLSIDGISIEVPVGPGYYDI